MTTPDAPTLRSLLQESIDALATSGVPITYRQIEEAVKAEESNQRRGLTLNRTTISQILKGTYKKTPTDGTILAIGWFAGVDDDVAFAAASRKTPGPPFAEELPQGVDDLSPKERAAALDLLRTLIAQRQEINRYREEGDELDDAEDSAGKVNDITSAMAAPPIGDELVKKAQDL